MGDIIRPDFSRRKKEESMQDNEEAKIQIPKRETKMTPAATEVVKAAYDVAYGEEKSPLLIGYLELSLSGKVQKLLNLAASQAALNQARETVKGYTTEELLVWMKNSTESDWQKKAGFFQAVWAELRKRMKI